MVHLKRSILVLLLVALADNHSSAQLVFWVTNIDDFGAGSLRQAILDANTSVSPVPDTIRFAIPGNNVHTIAPTYNLPVISDPVYIDGLSQTGASANSWPATLRIELSGNLHGSSLGEGLIIAASNCTIRGLVINQFGLNGIRIVGGHINRVESCFIGTNALGNLDLGNGRNGIFIGAGSTSNVIGGGTYEFRNLISGNDLTGITIDGETTKYNRIEGNYIGTDGSGLYSIGNGGKAGFAVDLYRAVYLNNKARENTIGGNTLEKGNIISGNLGHGIYINSGYANKVYKNFIGLDATGGSGLGNQLSGITIYSGNYNQIGATPGQDLGNVIADNNEGINLLSYSIPTTGNQIFDNIIGTSPGGLPIGNYNGIVLELNATDNEVHWNTIAHNTYNGITLSGNGVYNNYLVENRMYLNGQLAIDLNNDGVTINDSDDSDGGANFSQNTPILHQAFLNNSGKVEVHGTLTSIPNKLFYIHFYANGMCNSTIPAENYGEGELRIGSLTVTTASDGTADFVVELDGQFSPGRHITALATDEAFNTSEFSPCISIPNWPSIGLGPNDEVKAVVVDSSGKVYIGGYFDSIGTVPAKHLAMWDGTNWSEVGNGTNAPVYALHIDNQDRLLVGGKFTEVGNGISANHIARYDGSTWSTFGNGTNDLVRVIETSPSGTIYVGGPFTAADGNSQINGIARWNNIQWVGLGTGAHNVFSIAVAPNAEVYVGGYIYIPGEISPRTIAKWDGASWTGLHTSSTAGVNALAIKNNGNVYAADGHILLEYDGNTWQTLFIGRGHASIKTLLLDDGQNLFMGGQFYFSDSQGEGVQNLVMYDGSSFYTVGGGVFPSHVSDLAIEGNYLYAGGKFTLANGVPSDNLARFWINYINPGTSLLFTPTLPRPVIEAKLAVQVYPNPASDLIKVDYFLEERSRISIKVYNQNGQLLRNLSDAWEVNGHHQIIWDGKSTSGKMLPSGIYIITVQMENGMLVSRKVILNR